MATKSAESSHL